MSLLVPLLHHHADSSLLAILFLVTVMGLRLAVPGAVQAVAPSLEMAVAVGVLVVAGEAHLATGAGPAVVEVLG